MDFHCHLDLYPNARQVYFDALGRTEFVWLVTTSPKAYVATSKILRANRKLYISPGLHPEIVEKKYGELGMLLSQMEHCYGVGEVGLDGSDRYCCNFSKQLYVFRSIVEHSVKLGGRVLNIHSRAAAKEVLDILSDNPGFGTAILHWFTDSLSLLQRAVALGCWFSVGPAMMVSLNGRKLVAQMPRERVVSESDGPFTKINGYHVMPWQAGTVVNQLCSMWNLSSEDATNILKANGSRLVQMLNVTI